MPNLKSPLPSPGWCCESRRGCPLARRSISSRHRAPPLSAGESLPSLPPMLGPENRKGDATHKRLLRAPTLLSPGLAWPWPTPVFPPCRPHTTSSCRDLPPASQRLSLHVAARGSSSGPHSSAHQPSYSLLALCLQGCSRLHSSHLQGSHL